MKLNPDCIRDILLTMEAHCKLEKEEDSALMVFVGLDLSQLCEILPDHSKEALAYTLSMLKQAGYIKCEMLEIENGILDAYATDITFLGHQFLASIRDEDRWKGVKRIAGKVGDFSLKMVSAAAEGLGNAALAKLDLGSYLPIGS